jgi:hypothetical protein
MIVDVEPVVWKPFRERLERIYREMEESYRAVAARFGFTCAGCGEECCRSRFHQYTLLEYLFLGDGINTLPEAKRESVRRAARRTLREAALADARGILRPMCPLNFEGMCGLHPYRPIICRLHGVPHALSMPGRDAVFGPGCDVFSERHGTSIPSPLDRTPLYKKMAGLEKELREALNFRGKISLTVAEIIADE